MATIAKLDSNGIVVIPEPQPPPQTQSVQAGDSPQVDSSTGDTRHQGMWFKLRFLWLSFLPLSVKHVGSLVLQYLRSKRKQNLQRMIQMRIGVLCAWMGES